MAWESVGRPQTKPLTRHLAETWYQMQPVKVDRPLSQRRIEAYEKIAKAGMFRPINWASVYCKETDEIYRVNGKHTSTLFATRVDPKSVPPIYVIIEEYTADTLNDCVNLYSTFDSKTQTRSSGDINMSFASVIPELTGLHSRMVNLAVGGLTWFKDPVSRMAGASTAEKAELLFEYPHWVLWLCGLLGVETGSVETALRQYRFMANVPVAGAMFATYHRDKKDATAFWRLVRDETGEAGSPDRKLAKYLFSCTIRRSKRDNVSSDVRREMYAKSIHAWNAWRRGIGTALNYFPKAELPKPA